MKNLRFIIIVLFALVAAHGCTKDLPLFDMSYIAFDYNSSSSTSIDCQGIVDAQYYIHLTSQRLTTNLEVAVDVIPGSGMEEGVDYELITTGNVIFRPDIYDMPFRIRWLNHEIDKNDENTVTLRLSSSNMDNVILGMPGPDELRRTIVIRKY